jgi:hypothetical protein
LPQTHADLHGPAFAYGYGEASISVPRLAGLKESSHSRVKNPLKRYFPKGSPFCFAIVGKAKSLCPSRERSERVANKPCPIGSKANLPHSGVNPILPSLRVDTLSNYEESS